MLGLFGTLNLGSRALQAQRVGIEVAGHNMANANNPAYSRQRITMQTSVSLDSAHGQQGTGVDVTTIQRVHNVLIDSQIINESSLTGSLAAEQRALQYAQSNLGQQIDTRASGAEGAAAAQGSGTQHGISEALSGFFSAVQTLSSQPSSITGRDLVLKSASLLAEKFNQTDVRLNEMAKSLDDSVEVDVASVNRLLDEIGKLNQEVIRSEAFGDGTANDARDTRQQKLEELAGYVKIDAAEMDSGAINVSIASTLMVEGNKVVDKLEAFTEANGRTYVKASAGTALDITGGSIQGTIHARDGDVKALKDNLDELAASIIREVNAIHAEGYSIDGSTGENLFGGTGSADMSVNSKLVDNPALLQVAGVQAAPGDSSVAVAIAQLERKPVEALQKQTFSAHYSETVAAIGQSLRTVNDKVTDQGVIQSMLTKQRDTVSGVSLDEEMTDLVKFQKAFQASARLITTVDELLDAVISMKR